MSRRIRNLVVAVATVLAALPTAVAPAAENIPLKPSIAYWPFSTCDQAKFQYIVDAGDNYTMGPKVMCGGKGVLSGPGWWWRGWPGLVDGGTHYMSNYDAPTVPDASTQAEWLPTIAQPGMYDVWVSFRTTHNRADDAPYYFYADDGVERVAHVNQKGGAGEDGFRAVYLGNYYFRRHAMDKVVLRLVNDEGTHSKAADGLFMKYTGPQNVKGLTATSATSLNTISLKWRAVAGAKYYRIYRSRTNNPANAVAIANVKAPTRSYNDTPINAGKTWYYWVKAVGPMNLLSKNFSNMSTGKTGRLPAAPVVDGTAAAAVNSLTIDWSAVAGATSYKVYRGTSADPAAAAFLTDVAGAANPTYTDQGLPASTPYWYWVTAVNPLGEGAKSAAIAGTTLAGPAAPALDPAVVEADGVTVTLTWGAVAGATSYKVYRGTTNVAADATWLADAASATYQDNAGAGADYWYFVSTVDATGEGVRSAGVEAITPPAP